MGHGLLALNYNELVMETTVNAVTPETKQRNTTTLEEPHYNWQEQLHELATV